jgi:hypothetical protein
MRRPEARVFAVVVLCAFAARAQSSAPAPGLRVQVANCDEGFADRLPSVVKLEIDVLLRERGPTRSPPENIAVRCQAEKAYIEVTLDGSTRESTIDLHVLAAEHRARAVALAAAELVHSMAGRPRAQEAPPNPPAPPPIPRLEPGRPSSDALSRRSSKEPALLVGGLVEWRGSPAALLFGGRVAFQYPLGGVVIPELSLDASAGGMTSTSARVAVESLSTAAHLYFGTTTGTVRWDLGPGARFGWSRLAGQPDAGSTLQGQTLVAAWGGPEVRARVAYAASQLRPALLALQVGAGVIALPVRGLLDGSETVYAMDGLWVSACAEVGLGL